MKTKRLLSFLLMVSMVIGMMYIPAFADGTVITTDRTITLTASKDVVETNEEFTIDVSLSGDVELKGTTWLLKPNLKYFTHIKTELASPYVAGDVPGANVLLTYLNGDEFNPQIIAQPNTVLKDTIITYTFKANTLATTDELFDFTDVEVITGGDSWSNDDVSEKTEIVEETVTIKERTFKNVTKLYDTDIVSGTSHPDVYDGQPHTFKVTADTDANDGNPDLPVITYTQGGVTLPAGQLPTFTTVGTYTVGYEIVKEGYATESETITINITEADYTSTEIKFAGNEISNEIQNDEYYFTYDGAKNKFEVSATTVDGTIPEITYTLDGVTRGEPFEITTAGDYTISYTIKADNHKEINETITIHVTNAEIEDVKVGFVVDASTTLDITTEIEDNQYTYNYDGKDHQLIVTDVTTTGGAVATIEYSTDGGVTKTTTPPTITGAGKHTITYIITAPNHRPYQNTVEITITDPKYYVEVLLDSDYDYVTGDKMVLVYTDATKVAFDYADARMYDVSGGNYKYKGTEIDQEEFKTVYALVVPSITGGTLESYKDEIGVNYNVNSDYVIDYNEPYDINYSGQVEWRDIVAAYSVLEQDPSASMKGIIKADTDFSKYATTLDVGPIITTVYGTNN